MTWTEISSADQLASSVDCREQCNAVVLYYIVQWMRRSCLLNLSILDTGRAQNPEEAMCCWDCIHY